MLTNISTPTAAAAPPPSSSCAETAGANNMAFKTARMVARPRWTWYPLDNGGYEPVPSSGFLLRVDHSSSGAYFIGSTINIVPTTALTVTVSSLAIIDPSTDLASYCLSEPLMLTETCPVPPSGSLDILYRLFPPRRLSRLCLLGLEGYENWKTLLPVANIEAPPEIPPTIIARTSGPLRTASR